MCTAALSLLYLMIDDMQRPDQNIDSLIVHNNDLGALPLYLYRTAELKMLVVVYNGRPIVLS